MKRFTACWIDYYGNETMTQLHSLSTSVDAWDAITGISNADWTNYHEGDITSPSLSAPAADAYASVGDVLAVISGDVLVTSFQWFIPAPLKSIFDAGWNEVDGLDPTFSALQTATFQTLQVPQSGYPVNQTPAGWLLRQAPNVRESYITNPYALGGHTTHRRGVVWADSFGQRSIKLYVTMDVSDDWLVAAQACSNAIPIQTWEGPMQIHLGPFPFAAPYAGVKDTARLTFDDINGNRANIMVPAPKLEIFLADGKTVDRSNEGVGAVVAAVLAKLVAPQSGLSLVRYVGGILVRSRAEGLQ